MVQTSSAKRKRKLNSVKSCLKLVLKAVEPATCNPTRASSLADSDAERLEDCPIGFGCALLVCSVSELSQPSSTGLSKIIGRFLHVDLLASPLTSHVERSWQARAGCGSRWGFPDSRPGPPGSWDELLAVLEPDHWSTTKKVTNVNQWMEAVFIAMTGIPIFFSFSF